MHGAIAVMAIGAASIVYGGVLAVSRRTSSEMLAYSAIGQVGYVLVAIGIGGPVGYGAAILYTIVNAANKTMLFLAGSRRGAIVAGLTALGALSIAGVPPAAGFVGKLEIFRAVADSPILAAIVILGSLLSFVYAFQIYQYEHWQAPDEPRRNARRAQWLMPLALGALVLALGVMPEPLIALSQAAADAVRFGP